MTTATMLHMDPAILKQVHDTVGVGIWMWDAETDTATWNDEQFRLFGLEPQSIPLDTGTFLSLVHDDDRDRVSRVIRRAVQDGRNYEFDFRRDCPSGERRVLRGYGFVRRDELGNLSQLIGSCIDITASARADAALRENEERFRSIFEQSAVGIALTDVNLVFQRVNASFARMLGRTPEEMVGHSVFEYTHPADLELMRSLYCVRPERTDALTYEKRYLRSDGGFVWGRASVTRLRRSDGAVTGFLGMVEDITDRKTATDTLKRQSELLTKIMDNLPVMVSMFGADGRLLYVNRAWEKTLGWSIEETQSIDVLSALYPDPVEAARAKTAVTACDGHWVEFEPRARDGRAIPSSWAGIALSDGTKLTIGKDISERRAMQQRIVQSQRMEALGQLAGGVAHDFNNILTVVTACASFIKDAALGQNGILEDVKQIEAACDRAVSLTRQLLAFSRRQMLKPEVVDVNASVRNLSKTLNRLIGEHIELAIVPAADPATVEVDAHQLEQVILNLVVNARDAIHDKGTITIETSNEHSSPGAGDRNYVIIRVTDDGEGIPRQVRDRIFEPFFTTKAVGKGTGLGLATVLGIVEQSGGFIEVDSVVSQGTIFRVYLPSVSAEAIARQLDESRPDARGTETILLVEDEGAVREVARRVLAGLGYTVLEARHGADALTVSRAHDGPIHALVTDVVMPEMGGRELACEIRKQRPGLPILYVSGYTEDELLRRGVLESGTELIRKPFQPLELARVVRHLLGGDRAT